MQCVKSKGALLMMWICFGALLSWSSIPEGDDINAMQSVSKIFQISIYLKLSIKLCYPLIGWIADIWIGRYRAILYVWSVYNTSKLYTAVYKNTIIYLYPDKELLTSKYICTCKYTYKHTWYSHYTSKYSTVHNY